VYNIPVRYSDLTISRCISDLGFGGISVASCTFKTMDTPPDTLCADVIIEGVGGLPTFYVNKKTYSDGVWTVEALDRCAFLDRRIVPDDWDKTTAGYSKDAFRLGLAVQCGFGDSIYAVDLPSGIPSRIPCDLIDGQTYQSVLSSMALAYCGFFFVSDTSHLSFASHNASTSQITLDAYSRIHNNGSFSYGSVKVTNGSKSTAYGGGIPAGTAIPQLEINNNFANADGDQAAADIYSNIPNETYIGWSIDKAACITLTVPSILGYIRVESGGILTTYRATRIEARFVGSVMMLSMGQDIPQMGEIERRGLLQQKLDEAVSTQKTYKWMRTTYQGMIAVPTQDAEKGASS